MSQFEEPAVCQTSHLLALLVLESEQLLGVILLDENNTDHDKTGNFKPWSTPSSDTDILFLIHLSDDEDLQSRYYVLSVRNFMIFLAMTFLRILLILLPLIKSQTISSEKWARTELHQELNQFVFQNFDQSRYRGEISLSTLPSNPDGSETE